MLYLYSDNYLAITDLCLTYAVDCTKSGDILKSMSDISITDIDPFKMKYLGMTKRRPYINWYLI